MKYLKIFESFGDSKITNDLRLLLVKFLQKNITNDFLVTPYFNERGVNKGEALALNAILIRKNQIYNYPAALSIRILPVNDKQLRELPIKTKLKIHLKTCYDTSSCADQEFLNILIAFLVSIFKMNSYFSKIYHHTIYGKLKQDYDFFINVSDIDNIMNDLKEFEIYKDTSKYNL